MLVGAAGIVTGSLSLVLPIGIALLPRAFRRFLLSPPVRIGGRRAYSYKYEHSSDPFLNNRVARLLGQIVLVEEPVDENWQAECASATASGRPAWRPAAIGERVRIVDVDGNCLARSGTGTSTSSSSYPEKCNEAYSSLAGAKRWLDLGCSNGCSHDFQIKFQQRLQPITKPAMLLNSIADNLLRLRDLGRGDEVLASIRVPGRLIANV